MDEKKLSFEEGIQQLENILSGLEKDDMNLDDMLASYEKGMNIVKQLKAQLTEAETKLKVLQNGEIKETVQEDALE
ncbi:MAG: exodeoxyribonuclease VII small subunit [Christensenellales bacterium]|jgi:exodeoxyribonuclease VII small subunit